MKGIEDIIESKGVRISTMHLDMQNNGIKNISYNVLYAFIVGDRLINNSIALIWIGLYLDTPLEEILSRYNHIAEQKMIPKKRIVKKEPNISKKKKSDIKSNLNDFGGAW